LAATTGFAATTAGFAGTAADFVVTAAGLAAGTATVAFVATWFATGTLAGFPAGVGAALLAAGCTATTLGLLCPETGFTATVAAAGAAFTATGEGLGLAELCACAPPFTACALFWTTAGFCPTAPALIANNNEIARVRFI
jgi:hypothetical protein